MTAERRTQVKRREAAEESSPIRAHSVHTRVRSRPRGAVQSPKMAAQHCGHKWQRTCAREVLVGVVAGVEGDQEPHARKLGPRKAVGQYRTSHSRDVRQYRASNSKAVGQYRASHSIAVDQYQPRRRSVPGISIDQYRIFRSKRVDRHRTR
eukprot:564586-Rhodomonas_salina.1